jgi:CubicO group peptidase (beta-lactamase class C family)
MFVILVLGRWVKENYNFSTSEINIMINNKMLLLIGCFLLAYSMNLYSQNTAAELERFFSTAFRNQRLNGNVLIAEKGKIVYEKSFGYADVASKKLNSRTSAFHIASITKTFTGTAILQLVEKGKLDLDDPVKKHLKNFPYPQITVRHLLSHSSGLPSFQALFDSVRNVHPDTLFTNADIIPAYVSLHPPLLYEPLSDYNYNNINFSILGLIVEELSGMPLHNYLKKYILEPAGISETFFPGIIFYHYTDQEAKNLSMMYRFRHFYSKELERVDTVPSVSKYWYNYNFEGFGEIISTARDLFKYDQALYSNVLLRESTLKEAFTPTVLKSGKVNDASYGLCWIIEQDSSFGKLVMHGGGVPGLSSFLLRNITKHQTIIILDNNENEIEDLAMEALKILNKKKVKLPGKSIARLYARSLLTEGPEKAKKKLEELRKNTANYSLSEEELNSFGYELLGDNKNTLAVEVFRLNMRLFSESWNVYDSYGEALLKIGQKEQAIEMYKKSIELNPQNENGKRILKELL